MLVHVLRACAILLALVCLAGRLQLERLWHGSCWMFLCHIAASEFVLQADFGVFY